MAINRTVYFAINEHGMTGRYAQLLKVAVRSLVRFGVCDLKLLYNGTDNHNVEWFVRNGVDVVKHTSSFETCYRQYKGSKIASGAFLRLDIPTLHKKRFADDQYVLYFDCDVVFLRDPSCLDEFAPEIFAVAREGRSLFSADNINTGVMVMNTERMKSDLDALRVFCNENFEEVRRLALDQGLLKLYYRNGIDQLEGCYNFKSHWQREQQESPCILHFHGPKPEMANQLRIGNDFNKSHPQLIPLFTKGYLLSTLEFCKVALDVGLDDVLEDLCLNAATIDWMREVIALPGLNVKRMTRDPGIKLMCEGMIAPKPCFGSRIKLAGWLAGVDHEGVSLSNPKAVVRTNLPNAEIRTGYPKQFDCFNNSGFSIEFDSALELPLHLEINRGPKRGLLLKIEWTTE